MSVDAEDVPRWGWTPARPAKLHWPDGTYVAWTDKRGRDHYQPACVMCDWTGRTGVDGVAAVVASSEHYRQVHPAPPPPDMPV